MTHKNTRTDWIMLILSTLVIVGALLWVALSGSVQQALSDNPQWTWHFIRASGTNAYVLLAASVIWGMFLSSHLVKDWSPGPISIAIHSTISWLALVLTALHMGLLLLDKYLTFELADLFIPFRGPYRPEAVGLGTIALYIILLVNFSFAFKKRLGHAWWKRLHLLSYLSYGLVVAHAWLAGTDSTLPAMQLLLTGTSLLALLLLGVRLGRGAGSRRAEAPQAAHSASRADLEQRRSEARARAAARRSLSSAQDEGGEEDTNGTAMA